MLKSLNQRLSGKGFSLKITPELIKKVANQGYEPEFGARPMKRLIQDKIEDQIAQKLLKEEIKKGEEIEIQIFSFNFFPKTYPCFYTPKKGLRQLINPSE